jgi:hypothetical protein
MTLIPEQVEDAPERYLADGHGDWSARVDDLQPAGQPVGRVHRDRAHAVVAEVLLDLAHEQLLLGSGADAGSLLPAVRRRTGDRERVVDLGQPLGEDGLDDDALDLLDAPDIARGGVPVAGGLGAGGLCGDAGVHLRSSLLFIYID